MILRWAACCMAATLLAGCELIKAAEEPVDLYTVTPKSTFDPIDAYYVPLAGYSGWLRPGPPIRIYRFGG